MLAANEAKLLDGIFTDAALSGIDIARMNIRNNDNDFAYVMGKLCEAHNIKVGSLFTYDDVVDLAERNCTPNITCMMYILKDDGNEHDKVDFVQFYSPQIGQATAEQALRRIEKMLGEQYGIHEAMNVSPTKPRPPQTLQHGNRMLPPMSVEHIPSKQPYCQMSISAEATAHLRGQLQAHLDGISQALQQNRTFDHHAEYPVMQRQRHTFPLVVKYNSDKNGDIAVINPAPALGRMNEHVEARFQELGQSIVDYARRNYTSERILSDGHKVIITGPRAINAAILSVNHVDKLRSGKPSEPVKPEGFRKKVKQPRVIIVDDGPAGPDKSIAAHQAVTDPFEELLAGVAFRSIRVHRNELVGRDPNTLDEKGTLLQAKIVGILKGYLAEKGIASMEQFKASGMTEECTQHFNGITRYASMSEAFNGVTNSDIQYAMVLLINDLKLIKKNLRPEGQGEGQGAAL